MVVHIHELLDATPGQVPALLSGLEDSPNDHVFPSMSLPFVKKSDVLETVVLFDPSFEIDPARLFRSK